MNTINWRLTLGLFSGMVAAAGILAYILVHQGYTACNSEVGALAQGLSQQVANRCAADSLVHWLGLGMMIVGTAGILFARFYHRPNPKIDARWR